MIDRVCISLNARCNLKCVYCHFSEKKNNKNSLANEFSIDEVILVCKNIANYIEKNNIQSFKIGIVGSGEPLLSMTSLKAIVNYFYMSKLKEKIKMYVITNGTVLNESILNYFYEHKDIIELNVSLDGDPEINQKLRGNFPDLTNYYKKFGLMPKINSVVTKDVILNQDRILNYFIINGYREINFSKVFATDDSSISISNQEYEEFLYKAQKFGIVCRQNLQTKKYDCSKYGKLCGVGKNNIFITKTGIYPCGRFMDNQKYILGNWNDSISIIEKELSNYIPCPEGECYYEYFKVG